jgi:hypothetical protein
MRDNALVNLTGLDGHCMAIDLNIEHLIKFLKAWVNLDGRTSTNIIYSSSSRPRVSIPLGIALVISPQLLHCFKTSRNKLDVHLVLLIPAQLIPLLIHPHLPGKLLTRSTSFHSRYSCPIERRMTPSNLWSTFCGRVSEN